MNRREIIIGAVAAVAVSAVPAMAVEPVEWQVTGGGKTRKIAESRLYEAVDAMMKRNGWVERNPQRLASWNENGYHYVSGIYRFR